MRTDDASDPLDRDEFGGDGTDAFAMDATSADPSERVEEGDADADPEADEDLLEAELGECDELIAADDDLDDLDEPEPTDEELDDEFELHLLQELGIDLDAPDETPVGVEIEVGLNDDEGLDDEVAA